MRCADSSLASSLPVSSSKLKTWVGCKKSVALAIEEDWVSEMGSGVSGAVGEVWGSGALGVCVWACWRDSMEDSKGLRVFEVLVVFLDDLDLVVVLALVVVFGFAVVFVLVVVFGGLVLVEVLGVVGLVVEVVAFE